MVEALDLEPHPEGGWFRETYRAAAPEAERSAVTVIHFLLAEGQSSNWHRVDAAEVWTHADGAPLELLVSDPAGIVSTFVLGTDLDGGQVPHAVVPADQWQAARSLGAWTLVSCTVAPAFSFDGFELSDAGPEDPPPA